ncbi:MAG: ATPase, T2SS/T4P/T4SS family [Candidatus Diapherotrites archaeon]
MKTHTYDPLIPQWGWDVKKDSHLTAWKGTWVSLSLEEKDLLVQALELFYAKPFANQTENTLREALEEVIASYDWIVDPVQADYLLAVLSTHTLGAGPLAPLLHLPTIEEISITGIGESHPVRVFRSPTGWEETPLFFTHEAYPIALLNRLAMKSGLRLTAKTPVLNAMLPHHQRLHASIPPISQTPLEASIRCFTMRERSLSLLCRNNTISPSLAAYLHLALLCDANILIAGNTGSGKTTTLNALLHSLDQRERIILLEETPELQVHHPHVVRLIPNEDAGMDLAQLIRETLRMRPDRVVVGEMRHPSETKAWMESILAGQGKGTSTGFISCKLPLF